MRKNFSNEKLIKNNKYKLTSCFFLILLTIIIVSNANTAYAETETETIDPRTISIINVVGCNANDVIRVDYEIISGPPLDVYLREGATIFLMGPPSDYIKKDNDSNQGKWSHTVTSDDSDYSVIFVNEDTAETSTVRYTIIHESAFGIIYIILIVIGVVVVVGALIARSIIKKRRSVEPELKSEPTTQTIVKPLPDVEKKILSCPECGKILLEGSAFCIECGHQL
ncbi:hypothetical protein ES705_17065 [subsurface metagenome]